MQKFDTQSTFNRTDFPIVGIGASAGGLEAFVKVLANMPKDINMAFVLVQHLDPNHASMSVDIISKSTQLTVEEVTNGLRVRPNHVYVIPPNCSMEIHDRMLNLRPRDTNSNPNMSIDLFLQSLAQSEKEKAIGMILSGTGVDGTMGLWAIKSEGGITYAQEPTSAKYSSMPLSAISAGIVDLVIQPENLSDELSKITTHSYWGSAKKEQVEKNLLQKNSPIGEPSEKKSTLDEIYLKIFSLIRNQTKIDFSEYKQTTIKRRIQRRMMLKKIENLQKYEEQLQSDVDEIKALYNDLLINVTNFFRDPDSFEQLSERVFPPLLNSRPSEIPIRVWVPGCSTGEEVYSIAIALTEFLERSGQTNSVQIFATDISARAIQKARTGHYSENIVQHVSKERLERFFHKTEGGYKINKSIRGLCLFSLHDVTSDPPFANLDLISCRNVLIYFSNALQKRVIPIFHYGLLPNGFLWLGKSDSVGEFSNLFNLIQKNDRIYSKSSAPTPHIHFFAKHLREPFEAVKNIDLLTKAGIDFQKEADRILLTKFSPPSVLINAELDILQFRGRTAPFLEPAPGRPSLNLFKMARPELVNGLRSLFQLAKKENTVVERKGLHFESDGRSISVDIEIIPIFPRIPLDERAYLVLFKELEISKKISVDKNVTEKIDKNIERNIGADNRVKELLKELSETKEYQQSIVEQYESTQEALSSTVEELQSTNEEFQTANEEIETAKEELQSTNEELITVNEELQMRNADLTTLSSDLNNLLASIEIPVLIVDNSRCVRRYSPKAKNEFNLIPTDVGRRIKDIRPNFSLNLDDLVSEVIENLNPRSIEILDDDGKWRRVQIRPYKTVNNQIDGATIVLTDIDILKKKEMETMEARHLADKSNLAKDVFLATVSHELRTPLSSILTWAQLISQGKVDLENAKKGAEIIENSVKIQTQLIDDLLDISRIITGKLALKFKSFDAVSNIRTSIALIQPLADKKSIRIKTNFPVENAIIHADPIRLQQILSNLLTNAIKFSPENGVINVGINFIDIGNGPLIEINVSDKGKGIPPEFVPKLFNLFSQADSASSRVHGGLGLGLSIVRSLTEMQGGTVRFENAESGEGAVFTVAFPLLTLKAPFKKFHQNDDTAPSKNDIRNDPHLSPKLDGLRILIVDDDESALDAIQIYLKSFGAEVLAVGSAQKALEALPSFKPDVLVSDIAMPGEDGYSLIKKIRGLPKNEGGSVPALALSAYTTLEDTKLVLAAGFQGHIAKPVDAHEMGNRILRVLER